jgi:hypothetical protein
MEKTWVTKESIIVQTSLDGILFLLRIPNWTSGFAGVTKIRKAWSFVVIPVEARIQDS